MTLRMLVPTHPLGSSEMLGDYPGNIWDTISGYIESRSIRSYQECCDTFGFKNT